MDTVKRLREWAEGYMELKPCKTCGGARLKKESLWFKVDEKKYCRTERHESWITWLHGLMELNKD